MKEEDYKIPIGLFKDKEHFAYYVTDIRNLKYSKRTKKFHNRFDINTKYSKEEIYNDYLKWFNENEICNKW